MLAALVHRRGAPASKGDLAWETRANHYMATRVLKELADEGLVEARRRDDGGYDVMLTHAGRAFYDEHANYAKRTFGRVLVDHFRYGRAPAWAAALLATEG